MEGVAVVSFVNLSLGSLRCIVSSLICVLYDNQWNNRKYSWRISMWFLAK